ncbi:MAG: hypothetical protein KJO31_14960 [Gammaproteobacteria bacterium]|nr:hypothetical protein [Gammaproteobacteria bacterium]
MNIRQTINRTYRHLVQLCALLFCAACVQPATLAPADSVTRHGPTTAVNTSAGVTITASTDMWSGDADITGVITPVKVTVTNASKRVLRIRYADLSLVSEQGVRYATLPPHGIEDEIDRPAKNIARTTIRESDFVAEGFRVAAHYRALYPNLTPDMTSRAFVDPSYHAFYYPLWQQAGDDLPTLTMLRQVLPEGVLDPGGTLDGFLYFEYVGNEPGGTAMHFRVDLVDADTGQMFATLHIPFVVTPYAVIVPRGTNGNGDIPDFHAR